MQSSNCYCILVCRFLWEALVYGSEESSFPMVSLPALKIKPGVCTPVFSVSISARVKFLVYFVRGDVFVFAVCPFSHECFQEQLS